MKLFVAMKAVVMRDDGKVLVLREAPYDEGTETGKWDVPGGRINPEESVLEGLNREVREESGLEVQIIEPLGIGETFPVIKGEYCHIVRIYSLCKAVTTNVTVGPDHSEYEWIDPKMPDSREFVSDVRELIQKAGKRYF